MTQYAANIARDLGVYPINMDLPVLSELYGLRFGQLFLGIILNMIIVILFLLSVILLYNLLLISVETKTYELGVLRVLGFNKIGVIVLIIIQALSYVIPAIICGILLSIPFLQLASNMLQSSIGVEISIFPTGNAIALALGLGFLIPLFSSIVPIKSALSQQLSFALDLQRSKCQAVKIEIDVEGKQLPWGRIYFAIVSSMFGISIYYLLPLALLSFNIGLLLAIFFWILCGMLLGFVLLSFNFQYLFEKFVVWVFLFFTSRATKSMIIKNLAAHRIKNRRTALMFSLSIAFIIFIFTGMSVQINNQSASTLQKRGTYMEIKSTDATYNLPVSELEQLLEELKEDVEDFAWVTESLGSFMGKKGYQDVYITHLGKIYQFSPIVVGVSPSMFKLGFNQFLKIESQTPQVGLDPVEELYTARGSQSCIIGASYASYLELKVDPQDSFLLVVYNNTYSQTHEMRVSSVLSTAPGLTFSSLPSVRSQSVVVSLPTYRRLANGEISSYSDMPMDKLLLKFTNGANVDRVFTQLNSYLEKTGIDYNIWDYRDHEKSLQQSQQLISIIFTALTAVVMILSFFSLSSSMSANLLEQAKEISVLRAIGNSRQFIVMIYIMEAFVLVLSSSFIGLIVGWCIGYSMALQQTLFTQLPLQFVFPWPLLIAVIITSIITAILSTWAPAYRMLKQEIAQLMRIA